MNVIYLGGKDHWYKKLSELRKELNLLHIEIGNDVNIADAVWIGDWTKIGDGAVIGKWAKIGTGVSIGNGAKIENNVRIGYGTIIIPEATITQTPLHIIGIYDAYYVNCAYWSNGKAYEQFDSDVRTQEEWDNYFLNNFQESNDLESSKNKKNMFAHEIMKKWLEQNKP